MLQQKRSLLCLTFRRIDLKEEDIKPKYEHPVDDINWTAGVGQPAGIYWLEGRSVIAGHGTRAESRLLDLGAILIATLRFDPDPLERSHPGRVIERVDPRVYVIA